MTISTPYKILEEIKIRIINSEYKPYQKLSEKIIAADFKVSKTPAREALTLLCREGFVECRPRSGYYVLPVSTAEQEMLLKSRVHIESVALRIIAQKCTDEEINTLCVPLEKAQTDNHLYMTNNYHFHSLIGKLSGNKYINEFILKLVSYASRPLELQEYMINYDNSNYFHRAIIQALLNRDAEAAVHYLKCDILPHSYLHDLSKYDSLPKNTKFPEP